MHLTFKLAVVVALATLSGCSARVPNTALSCDCGNFLAEFLAPEPPGRYEDPRSFYIFREEETLAELDRAIRTQNDEIYAIGRQMRREALERHWEKYGIVPTLEARDEL